ncbi:acyl-coenzyme A thioesterase 3-like [Tympanuchus pallidicinctus]|uniref:acyl-coenzyme A thioesterase 3-like n=1 Tax=Tympanuchus pallidicinctus TaxID=109042 RepID=UPI0022872474|nr:acyl-coenzyme A thioesterase 3-like [Tympanuchus pallidicinctus]
MWKHDDDKAGTVLNASLSGKKSAEKWDENLFTFLVCARGTGRGGRAGIRQPLCRAPTPPAPSGRDAARGRAVSEAAPSRRRRRNANRSGGLRSRLRLPGGGGRYRRRRRPLCGSRPRAAVMWRAAVAAKAQAWALRRGPARGAVSVAVTPAAGLADERVDTRVAGLGPGQPVTLRAVASDERGCLFQSCAHYRADGRGELHLGTDASHGGDYTGVEPMGLFWSLAPAGMERPYQRLVPRSTGIPMKVEMLVHRGHSQSGAIHGPVMAKAEVERWFTAPGVRRIRLKEGAVRGSLFLPPGDGPFPGVIDMYGDEGGLVEFRSSLLATRGFAALSLPYFDFEDLPKVMKEFKLEYFEEAARFLQRHPKAIK